MALAIVPLAPSSKAETRWTLIKNYPHDPKAFTEGLLWADGGLYESTGLNGASDIRQVRLKDGKVLRRTAIEPQYFGEGIVNWGNRIISLTWRHRQGFIWDRKTFKRIGTFRYEGEGWALTHDGRSLIMSDGTAQLRFLDPQTLQEQKRVTVTWNGKPLARLNELEYVKGEVLANIWYENRIARINPITGAVADWIDLSSLASKVQVSDRDAVLNGIAYDAAKDRLFVTGKFWPKLFEIKLQR